MLKYTPMLTFIIIYTTTKIVRIIKVRFTPAIAK